MRSPAMQQTSIERGAAFLDAQNAPHVSSAPERLANVAERGERTPPSLDEKALHGLAGEIVRLTEPHTEADMAAILVQTLVAFGALVGRGPHVRVEGDEHHANLFTVLVGATSKARKGTSWGRVNQFFSRITDCPNIASGLSSGEGLKWAVRDRITKIERDKSGAATEVEVDPGVNDKRLLVRESEFVQVLRQASRPGNTLSAVLRESWDTGRLATLTKNDAVTATGAHICVVGHITADELRAELTATDSANGFANRFLFLHTRRSKALPFGGDQFPSSVIEELSSRLALAALAARRLQSVTMTEAARDVWRTVYSTLSEGHPGLFGAVTGRAEAQTLRLALVYALIDQSVQIDRDHVLAALALWEYCEGSARFIFGSALGDPVADELDRALRASGEQGMTRTQIRDHFKRHKSADRIDAALDLLVSRNRASVVRQATNGAPAEIWRAQ